MLDGTFAGGLGACDEEREEVKRWNQMIALAKVQTIRDLQIEEKQRLMAEQKETDLRADDEMEAARKRALELLEAREQEKAETRLKGSLTIVNQIKEREDRKIMDDEQKEKERLWMVKQLSDDRASEERQTMAKQEAQRKMLHEVLEANEISIRQKAEKAKLDKELDLRLLDYQRQRAEESRLKDEAAAKAAADREAEIAKLRAKQERAQDKAVELDALRAMRAFDDSERAARERERREQEAQKLINETLAEARRVQHAEKQLALIEQARIEKLEFDRLVESQEEQRRAEELRERKDKEMRKIFAENLRKQIVIKSQKQAQQRQDYLEEGNLVRAKSIAEKKRLDHLRKQKIEQVIRSGVPAKHCLNLKKALLT
jgi:hypothetical protein